MSSRSIDRRGIAALALFALFALVPRDAAAAPCDSLTRLALPDTVITLAETVAAGAFTPPATGRGRGGAPAAFAELPAFCRVAATLHPTSESSIKIEVWMPARATAASEGGGGWNASSRLLAGRAGPVRSDTPGCARRCGAAMP